MTKTREPPEMVPGAEERRGAAWERASRRSLGRGIDEHELRRAVVEGFTDAYRDGWNAARAEIERLTDLVGRQAKTLADMMSTR